MNEEKNKMQEQTISDSEEKTMEGGVWGIVIVISAFFIQFLAFGATASIGVYNIELLDYFDNDTVGVSLIAAINFGVFLGSGPIVSLMMTRFSYRKIALFGSILVVLGLLGMPLLPYIPAMCFCFGVLAGFGSCCVYIPSHVLSGLYYDKYRSLATGVATSGSGLGFAIMPVIVGLVIDAFTWKGSFIILAGLCLHLFVFSALLRSPPTFALEEDSPSLKDSDEAQLPKALDTECQCPLIDDSLKNGISNSKGNKYVKDHDFLNVDMSELEFIDKLSWRPETGFVSECENAFLIKEDGHSKAASPSHGESDHVSDKDSNKDVNLKENGSLTDYSPASAEPCDNHDQSIEAHTTTELMNQQGTSDQMSLQLDKNNLTPPVYKHFYIFTNYEFDIYFINNVMWNLSLSMVQAFAPEFLRLRGLTPMEAAWVIGGFGMGCFIGGVLGGVGGNFRCVNRLAFFTAANFLMGVVIIILPLSNDIVVYAVTLMLSGLFFGVILGLLIVVLTDLIGIESLGNGLCYLMLANGIGTFTGPPLAGGLQAINNRFDESLYFSGAVCILGGFIMLFIPFKRCFSA